MAGWRPRRLALPSTARACVVYFRCRIPAAVDAARLLLVTFLVPVTAVLLRALVLDETLRHTWPESP